MTMAKVMGERTEMQPKQLRLVMKQGAALALIGTLIGLAIAYLSGRIVASQIYMIRASDPLMLSGAIVVVVGIAAIATMIPAWRASRLNPSGVLHSA